MSRGGYKIKNKNRCKLIEVQTKERNKNLIWLLAQLLNMKRDKTNWYGTKGDKDFSEKRAEEHW